MRIAKEQPVFTACAFCGALLHKGAERRDTGTRANHDHRRLRISGQTEVVVMFDKHAHFAIFFHAIRQEAGSSTRAGAPFNVVAHHTNRDMHFVFGFRLGRGDGVKTRRQRAQQANQLRGVKLRRSKTHHINNRGDSGVML